VNVYKDDIKVRSISMNDYFGERALLFDEVRSATVIAEGLVECWVLGKEEFITYISQDMRDMLMDRIGL